MIENYNVSKMIERNQPRTKNIERSGQKTDFSPWRLGGQKPCGGGQGGGFMEEKHPREDASHAIENLVHWRGGAGHGGQREK
jgi:hypothetical protein